MPEQDIRFGDATLRPTAWSDVRGVLQTAELFWISTVRRNGRPHVTPLTAVWHGDRLHFCTGQAEQKAVNLVDNNRQVVLTTGCNHWKDGLDVVVEGRALQVGDDLRLHELADVWRAKYHGDWDFAVAGGRFRHDGGDALVFEVVPTKVLAFAKGPFGQTRFRFEAPEPGN